MLSACRLAAFIVWTWGVGGWRSHALFDREVYRLSLISCTLNPNSWPPSKNGDLVAATAEGENKVIYPDDCSSWHKLNLYPQPLFQLAFGMLS